MSNVCSGLAWVLIWMIHNNISIVDKETLLAKFEKLYLITLFYWFLASITFSSILKALKMSIERDYMSLD